MATSAALPPGLRLSLSDRIDRRLAAIIAGSLVVHGAIAGYAWVGDAPSPLVDPSYAALTYQQDVIDISLPDAVDPIDVTPTTEPGAATTPASPQQTPRPIVPRTRVTTRPSQPVPIDSQHLASILTGTGGETRHPGSMSPRQPQVDLGAQLANARTGEIGDGTRTTPRIVDPRLGTTDRAPLVEDPTLARAPHTQRDEQTGRIIAGTVKPETSSTLSAATVLARINSLYMAGLQRCYRLGLAEDSTLAGRVAIAFTVDDRGHVIDADASGVSRTVDTCIGSQMKAWRFPIPKDDDGSATDASFSVSLALQPS